jgi:hypothetical protein
MLFSTKCCQITAVVGLKHGNIVEFEQATISRDPWLTTLLPRYCIIYCYIWKSWFHMFMALTVQYLVKFSISADCQIKISLQSSLLKFFTIRFLVYTLYLVNTFSSKTYYFVLILRTKGVDRCCGSYKSFQINTALWIFLQEATSCVNCGHTLSA